jgi:hypothetical protein
MKNSNKSRRQPAKTKCKPKEAYPELRSGHAGDFGAANSLPSYLRITRAPSWARANNMLFGPALYHEVWIDNESRWGNSERQQLFELPVYHSLWDKFGRATEFVYLSLASVRWDKVSEDDLVQLYELFLTVEIGIQTFAPPEIADFYKRKSLFFDTLIRKAILDQKEGSQPTPKYALTAYVGCLVGPVVQAEIPRRTAKHVGRHVAILQLCCAMVEDLPEDKRTGFESDDSRKTSERILKKLISRHLNRNNILDGYPVWRRQDIESDILGRIYEALKGGCKYVKHDPLQTLRASLKGQLNIFPEYVANRMKNSLRSVSIDSRFATHKNREEPHDLEEIIEYVDKEQIKNSFPADYEKIEAKIDIDRFLRVYPGHRDTMNLIKEAELLGTTVEKQAAKQDISDGTLRLRKRKLKEDLRNFVNKKLQHS